MLKSFETVREWVSPKACGMMGAAAILALTLPFAAAQSGRNANPKPEASKQSADPRGYRIGVGDVLQIMVWGSPEHSVPGVQVRNDGKITVPFAKEISAVGLTTGELEVQITERISNLVKEPQVSVLVRELNSERIHVLGAVKREGPMQLKLSMNVLQAISEAGGLTDYAKKKKIYVLRTINGKPTQLPFNYEAVLKGEKPEQNILLLPGDTIVVPR